MKIIVAIFLLTSSILFSQGRVWIPKSFDSLEVSPKIDLDEGEKVEFTKGFFPIPIYTSFTIGIFNEGSFVLSDVNGINPKGLKSINGTYSSKFNEDTEHRYFKKKFSDDDEDTEIERESNSWGLDFRLTPDIGIPIIFRAAAMFTWSTDLLFSMDYSKSYLDYDNTLHNYFEINNLLLEETQLETKLGVSIPIYGAFISHPILTSSVYSLYLGLSNAQVLSSSASQFVQIGNAKNKIRFENGLDTLVQTSNIELPSLIKNRFGMEIGVELGAEIFGLGMNASIKALIPTGSILSDESWKQYQIRLGTVIYFGGLLRLL